ncbi:Hypotetical protein, putative [Plasmodium sp.]|nr:Hypotetical protein, putative [Plasmodium sp.]
MLFRFFKLFIFILVLNIILHSNKNNNNIINIFEKIKNNKKFHIRINKYLAEYIKNENTNYESTEFNLLYEEMVKQKLNNYKRLIDLSKKEKNYKKKKLRDKKWQDKVVRNKIRAYYVLIGDYNKYYEMRGSFNFIETKNKMKNKLYEIIFKGTRFWKRLGFFLEFLGICAVNSMIFVIHGFLASLLLYIVGVKYFGTIYTVFPNTLIIFSEYFIVFYGIYGVCILLIIITVVVVILFLVWLWPKDDENNINKILYAK